MLTFDVVLQMKFQLEREIAVFVVTLKGADVQMAIEVSFGVRDLIETLPTAVVWTGCQPRY